METPAETAARFGVKPMQLTDLLEVPKFAEALAAAQANPDLSIAALIVAHDLPTKPNAVLMGNGADALDVDRMHTEAVSNRLRRERLEDVGRRSDGTVRSAEQVQGGALTIGLKEKAQKQANKRLQVLEQLDSLLADTTNNGLPAVTNVNAARKLIKNALP